jgi:excisionase family DNA binding protein
VVRREEKRMPITGTFYTATEIAEIHGVDERTVRRWIQSGHLKAIRILQGLLLVEQSALDKFKRPRMGRPKTVAPSG